MSRFYGIYLLIALIGVSGAVAYVGDIVGRRMGRKRLSLFGMRPRHTAIAISVVAGMLITIITLAVAMALSLDVRLGFLKVGQMRADIRHMVAEMKQMTAEHTKLSGRITSLDAQIKSLTSRAEQANREREKAGLALQKAKQALSNAEREVRLAKRELARSQGALRTTELNLGREQARLREAQQAVKSAQKAVERQSQKVAELTEEQANLTRQISSLQHGRELLKIDYLDALARERTEGVIFEARQPLDVLLVNVGQPPAEIRKQLDGFVAKLDAAVRKAGAATGEGTTRAVVVTELVEEPKTHDWVWASEDSVLDGLVESAQEEFRKNSGLRGIVVQASSLRNVHPGEPVLVEFRIFGNELVFTKGTKLAETTVPAGLSDAALMESLVALLTTQVRPEIEGKVMPQLDPSVPHANPQAGRVGRMSYGELFDVIAQIKQLNGPAHITAVAKDDTWMIGPLNVELRVEPTG